MSEINSIKSEIKNATMPEIKRGLIDKARIRKWMNDKLMQKMDQFAFARSLFLFSLMAFFLGNNLPIFLWLYVGIGSYAIVYRALRFWVKKWLMYIVEFCYFGNFILIAYIVFYGHSLDVFSIAFVCCSGVMTLAVIVFNNQAEFSSTDHLTSAFIHTLPLISVWAIRWKHLIYGIKSVDKYGLRLMDLEDVNFDFTTNFSKLVCLPLLFWGSWAICYFILTQTLLNRFVYDDKTYGSGVGDFVKGGAFAFIFGDHKRYRVLKYLIQHFFFFIIAMPVTWICFYSFYFNTVYLLLIIVFLGWNTGRNNQKRLAKALAKVEKASVEQAEGVKKEN